MFAMMLRCLFAGMLFHASSAFAAEAGHDGRFPIQAAILFEDDEQIAGATTCLVGEACQIFAKESHGVRLSLKVSKRRDHCLVQELSLSCAEARCSFDNGKSNVTFSNQQRFDFFEGGDSGVETLLVLRTRWKIGRFLLIVPPLGRTCLAPEGR